MGSWIRGSALTDVTALTTEVGADAATAGEDLAPAGAWSRLRRRPLFWISSLAITVIVLIAIVPAPFAGIFGHGNPHACNLINSDLSPRAGHPFGFDVQGCDLYANVIYGARNSVSIGLLVAGISMAIAVFLGSLSGFYGRFIDTIVARVSDILFGFPLLLGALVILNSLRVRNVLSVSLVLALFTWPSLTRLMRASVLSVRNMDYILATRSLGAGDWWIIRRHIVPNAIAPVVIIGAITIGGVIGAEATLTFLGIGLQSPAISWGLQLSDAQQNFQSHPALLIFPAAFLSVTVLAFIVLGECLQDALDPRRRDD